MTTDLTPQRLGELIRTAREDAGWKRARLAVAIDVDPSTLYRWETGEYVPDFHFVVSIAELLDKPLAYFADAATAATP